MAHEENEERRSEDSSDGVIHLQSKRKLLGPYRLSRCERDGESRGSRVARKDIEDANPRDEEFSCWVKCRKAIFMQGNVIHSVSRTTPAEVATTLRRLLGRCPSDEELTLAQDLLNESAHFNACSFKDGVAVDFWHVPSLTESVLRSIRKVGEET